jgi:tetratricopeptide (TPR) repeat protein
MLLLSIGAIDQMHYYLTLRADKLQDLRRAARLNSYDSSVQMRLARRELDLGETQPAEAAWQEAIAVDPADPAPRQGLLRMLIHQNRDEEALRLTETSLQYTPKDVNLLVDRGLLAQRRGRNDLAVASWKQALDVDPSHASAHLLLAEELDRQGKLLEAAGHYKAFLSLLSHTASEQSAKTAGDNNAHSAPPPETMIAVVIRLADCEARAAHVDESEQAYQMAEKLAVQTHLGKLESLAEVNEAALQGQSGRVDEALRLYQHALQLDRESGDEIANAEDWAAYGQFLSEQGFPARLAYAALVQSEMLRNPLPDALLQKARSDAVRTATSRLGNDAGRVRHDLERNLGEALAFRR